AMEQTLKTSRPVLIEAVTERFRGHSISDPGLYRSKEQLKKTMEQDPIQRFLQVLIAKEIVSKEDYEALDKKIREQVIAAMKFADESPWPDPITLEEGVFAPEEKQ